MSRFVRDFRCSTNPSCSRMTDSQWTRLAELIPDAMSHPEDEREGFLLQACTDSTGVTDELLFREARSLLTAAETAESSNALVSPLNGFARAVVHAHRTPAQIGLYEIIDELGEGGMGIVYRARRADGLVAREVALKRLHPALGRTLAGRLDAERETLARLEHEGVARLYDAGIDDDGAPFIVMECVEGVPITAYANTNELGVTARIELFVQVCEAVTYAHQNLIVHRDLKPSNVFVTEAGRIKLLDFGIAKWIGEVDPTLPLLTHTGHALTPSYAAPEQVRPSIGPVTTATDVYALGVMLYELLSGKRPYSVESATASETERIICDSEASLLSSAAPETHRRVLRGDLETIVARAMAKEPVRRYVSAAALREDLTRYLNRQPIEARPATTAYRISRFIKRHRIGVTATTLIILALVAGLAGTAWQARTAAAEARKAEALNTFLLDLLTAPDPREQGRDVRVATLLDHAVENLDDRLIDSPETEAQMRHVLGVTYRELGLLAEADTQLSLALGIRQTYLAHDHRDVLATQSELGRVYLLMGQHAVADSLLTIAVDNARAALRPDDILLGELFSTLGYVRYRQGDLESSGRLHQAVAEIHQTQSEPNEVEVAAAFGNVAIVMADLGRLDEALEYMEHQLALYRRTYEPDNIRIARALGNIGTVYYDLGRYEDAITAHAECVAIFRRATGDENVELAWALGNLGATLTVVERFDESEEALRESILLYEAQLGLENPRLVGAYLRLGRLMYVRGDIDEAVELLQHSRNIASATLPEGHRLHNDVQAALDEAVGN